MALSFINKSLKLFFNPPILFSLLAFSLLFSCRPYGKEDELRKVDSLQAKLEKTRDMMVIDVEVIKERLDSMKKKRKLVMEVMGDELSDEDQFMLTDYEAVIKNYKNFVDNYELMEMENNKHQKRLEDLKTDFVEENIGEEAFNKYYNEEKKIVNEHYETVKQLIGSVAYIEQNYNRQKSEMKPLYQKAKQKAKESSN